MWDVLQSNILIVHIFEIVLHLLLKFMRRRNVVNAVICNINFEQCKFCNVTVTFLNEIDTLDIVFND